MWRTILEFLLRLIGRSPNRIVIAGSSVHSIFDMNWPSGPALPEVCIVPDHNDPISKDPLTMSKVVYFKGMEHLSAADLRALDKAAKWIGVPTSDLAACIAFESANTFSPSKYNAAGSGAVGLIQFMPSTARRLGTTTAELARMTFQQQLEYVKKYFAFERGKLKNLQDLYLAIFYPKEIGRSPDDVIASEGSAVYDENAGFDVDGKGYITRGDVTRTIVAKLNAAVASGKTIDIPTMGTATAIALGGAGYALYTYLRKDVVA